MSEVCDLRGTASQQSQAALCCQLCTQGPSREQRREEGFVSNNDIIDRLERDQGCSTTAISRNRLRPSVHYGTEPLSLRLASSLVFNPAPQAFRGTNPTKSRLFHPELGG